MTLNNFEDLEIWKLSRTLSKEIYQITNSPEFNSDIRFRSQIRAAAGSIMDNIAEGFEREGKKEFTQFLYVAKGSCGEVRSQLCRAMDVGFISTDQYTSLAEQTKRIGAKVSNMIRYLKTSEIEGNKFKK